MSSSLIYAEEEEADEGNVSTDVTRMDLIGIGLKPYMCMCVEMRCLTSNITKQIDEGKEEKRELSS